MRALLTDLFQRLAFGPRPAQGPLTADADADYLPDVIRLTHDQTLVRGRHGMFLVNSKDQYLGRAMSTYGEYGEIEQRFLATLLREGDTMIEIGANIGTHTVGLARCIGPSGKLLAIEPQPGVYQMLCANVAMNALTQVETVQAGCGEQASTMYMPAYRYGDGKLHNSGAAELRADAQGEAVSVLALDTLAAKLAQVRLLKIDVEGMEREVLLGARELIARTRPLIYLENDRRAKSPALISLLQELGYAMWWHVPPLFNPANAFGVSQNIWPGVVSINMICLPAEAADEQLVAGLTAVEGPQHFPHIRG